MVNELLHRAQVEPGREVCGLIGGRGGEATSLYPVPNVSAAPARLFEMEPAGQIAAMRRMRERGEDLLAIYHSHPAAPAVPSATDLGEAGYPEALYLIVSLGTKGVLELRAYRLSGGQAREEEIVTGG